MLSDTIDGLIVTSIGNPNPTTEGYPGVPGESHFASLGGDRIHYVTLGKGKRTVVFIHGWAGHVGVWREQASALAGKARLIFIDLPGHGKSDKPQTDYTLDYFAEAVLAVLEDANVDKAIFIAHSMGAAVLCRLCLHAPEKVAALVSVDGLLRRPHGSPEEARALVAPFGTPHYLEHARRFLGSFFPIPGTETLRDQMMPEMLATPQHVMLGAMMGMFGPNQPDWLLEKVDAPVAVINAPSFWWTNGYESYVRSLNPQSDYILMEGVGHFLMLEKPAEFNATLSAMLRKFGSLA